jgi:hypothetical protein
MTNENRIIIIYYDKNYVNAIPVSLPILYYIVFTQDFYLETFQFWL